MYREKEDNISSHRELKLVHSPSELLEQLVSSDPGWSHKKNKSQILPWTLQHKDCSITYYDYDDKTSGVKFLLTTSKVKRDRKLKFEQGPDGNE